MGITLSKKAKTPAVRGMLVTSAVVPIETAVDARAATEFEDTLPNVPDEDTNARFMWTCASLASHRSLDLQEAGWIVRDKSTFDIAGYPRDSTYYLLKRRVGV